eukprot:gene9599-10586_t
MIKQIILIALVGLAFGADLESKGKLLASKSVLNPFIVQNKDVTIIYRIYNIGSSSAYNVMLKDDSFQSEDFKIVRGQSSVQWNSIPPNANLTHVLVIQPYKSGYFNFTAAQVTYEPTDGGEKQTGYTSAPGEGGIISEIDFNRKHSPHLVEWSMFALMCTPSILVPFFLWYRSYSKYNECKQKKA